MLPGLILSEPEPGITTSYTIYEKVFSTTEDVPNMRGRSEWLPGGEADSLPGGYLWSPTDVAPFKLGTPKRAK